MSHSNTPKPLHVATPGSLGPVTPEEASLLEKLDLTRLPRHVAVIMDGNGRWAQKRHLPRIAGHRSGTQSARTTIETCARLKIEALTLYAFSVENWRRPKTEIDFLMAHEYELSPSDPRSIGRAVAQFLSDSALLAS